MDIHQYLTLLGRHLGIKNLTLDKNQVCRICLNQGFDVFIEPEPHRHFIHLYSVLGKIPEDGKQAIFEAIFDRNLFGKETDEFVIQCDIQAQEILLSAVIKPNHLTADYFTQLFDRFVEHFKRHQAWIIGFNTLDQSPQMITPINPALLV
ncbi:hypothetical protein TDB9533_00672 [Thalassocella blandensis]|nr:hypothetical protein TDB9533_00672 [Thalassocella blandensis]